MIIKKIFALILLIPSLSFAQVKLNGKIVDAKTKQPIPFTNIENFRAKIGTQTNQDGTFTIDLPNGKQTDTLKISCLGYVDKLVSGLSDQNVNYELTPIVFQLKEVIIGKIAGKEIEVGVLSKRVNKWERMNERLQHPGMQNAVYMKNPGYESVYIEKLHFFIGSDMFDAPFRVRIYDNNNGIPGKALYEKDLIYSAVKKKSWNAFDVSSLGIMAPKDGFWVAIEWIANDKFKRTAIYDMKKLDGTIEKGSFIYYGPNIVSLFDTDFGLTYYKSLAGSKWFKKSGGTGGLRKKMRPANIDLLVKSTLKIYE